MSSERLILDEPRVGVVVLDADRRVVKWNEWMSESSGVSADAALKRVFTKIFPAVAGTGLAEAIDAALEMELSTVLSRNLRRSVLPLTTRSPEGARQSMDQSVLARPFRDHRGARLCVIQVTDVSATCRREAHLRGVAEYARMLFEAGLDPLTTVDRDGRISDVNRAFEKAAGLPRRVSSAAGSPITSRNRKRRRSRCGRRSRAGRRPTRRSGSVTVTARISTFSTTSPSSGDPTVGRGGGGVFAFARDLTERLKAARELEILATTDSLTELADRRHFLDQAEREAARSHRCGRELSLFLIDIDHFKRVDDTHGHGAGDEVSRAIAEVFRASVRSHDVVGRMGGEEFAVLLPETAAERAAALAERLRRGRARRRGPGGGDPPLDQRRRGGLTSGRDAGRLPHPRRRRPLRGEERRPGPGGRRSPLTAANSVLSADAVDELVFPRLGLDQRVSAGVAEVAHVDPRRRVGGRHGHHVAGVQRLQKAERPQHRQGTRQSPRVQLVLGQFPLSSRNRSVQAWNRYHMGTTSSA